MSAPVCRPPRSRICAPLALRWASRFRCPICPKWPTLSACLDAPCTSSSNRAPPVRPADCQYPFANWPRPSSVKSHFEKRCASYTTLAPNSNVFLPFLLSRRKCVDICIEMSYRLFTGHRCATKLVPLCQFTRICPQTSGPFLTLALNEIAL